MSALFGHDHKFREIKGSYYSTGGLGDDVLSRYVNLYEKITVIARVIHEDEVGERYAKIENPNVTIVERKCLNSENLRKLILDNDYIIVRLPSKIGSEIVYEAKKQKKIYFVEMVACAWDALWNYSLIGKLVAPFMFLLTRHQTKTASFVLYVTEQFLQSRYPTRGKSIGCSDVALMDFSRDIIVSRRQKIEEHTGTYVIGTTAAIDVRYKGQEFVIRALGKLKNQGIVNFEYHLVGNGKSDYLKEVAKDVGVEAQVKFLGGLPHDRVYEWLDSIDVYVQPSKVEGLPRALVEAMSRALPCIGSQVGEIPELLNKSCIFAKGDVDEIVLLLKNINKGWMIEQAVGNYKHACDYDRDLLDVKRNSIYEEYKNYR